MIGTKVVVGYDQNAVVKGLHGMTGMFGKVFKQIGIGAARQVGVGLTNMLGSIPGLLWDSAKASVEYFTSLQEISEQTGIATEKLAVFFQTLKRGGVDIADPGKILSGFAAKLFDASEVATNPMGKFIEKLFGTGLGVHFLREMPLMEAIDAILDKMSEALKTGRMDMEELSAGMFTMFPKKGGGAGFLKLMGNLPEGRARAAKDMVVLAPMVKQIAKDTADAMHALERFGLLQKVIGGMFIKSFLGITGGADEIDKFFDNINNNLAPIQANVDLITAGIVGFLKSMEGKTLEQNLNGFAEMIGASFSRGILKGLDPLAAAENFGGAYGFNSRLNMGSATGALTGSNKPSFWNDAVGDIINILTGSKNSQEDAVSVSEDILKKTGIPGQAIFARP